MPSFAHEIGGLAQWVLLLDGHLPPSGQAVRISLPGLHRRDPGSAGPGVRPGDQSPASGHLGGGPTGNLTLILSKALSPVTAGDVPPWQMAVILLTLAGAGDA